MTGWLLADECLMNAWWLADAWWMTRWWLADECLKALQRYFHLNFPTKIFAWNFQTFSHSSVASVRQKIMAPFLTLLSLLKTSFCPKSRKILLANKKFPQCSVENKFKSICNKISQNMKCNVDLFTDKRLRYFFKYFFEVHNSKLKELNWEFGSEKFIFLSTLTIIHHCFICQRF